MPEQKQTPLDVDEWHTIGDWVNKYGSPIVVNVNAMRRFIRRYRHRWLDLGIYIPGSGRRPSYLHREIKADLVYLLSEQAKRDELIGQGRGGR